MIDNSRKLGLTSICILFLGILTFIGIDLLLTKEPPNEIYVAPQEVKPSLAGVPYKELLGRWQSLCNYSHFDRPVIVGIDFRPNYIRWSNQFFLDKSCTLSEEVERNEYFITYVEDVRILGDISARLFRLKQSSTDENGADVEKQEVFRAEDGWLYISADGSGPDYSKPWDLDSNLGLRQTN